MPKSPAPAIIAVLAYPGAQRAAVHGLADLFETAARLDAEARAAAPRMAVKHFSARDLRTRAAAPNAALIVPPSLVGTPGAREAAHFAPWIRAQHRRGTRICSVCAGAFLLAETGLLDGRRATTHWALADEFARRFPRVALDVGELLIDDGDIVTAGGVMAWIDLGLRLIERLTTPAIMLATARMFLVDPGPREQRFYSNPAPRLQHGDAAILEVQQWLQAQCSAPVTVSAMAARAALGERTFLRRFQGATGQTPTSYLQQLRVTRSRELLELSRQSVDEIAWKVGYTDPSAFRKVFRRIVGLSPGVYRERFTPARR